MNTLVLINKNLNMLQQPHQSQISHQQHPQPDNTSVDYSLFKDPSNSLERLDYSTSTVNDPKRNSSNLDNLLYSSFVELDQFVQRQNQTFNLDIGQSFFKRSNNLFFSDFGKRQDSGKMCHKKVQCQIGKGSFLSQNQHSNTLISKFKTLQVLKMIKLIKLILKQLKQSVASIRQQAHLNDVKYKAEFFDLQSHFSNKLISVNQEMNHKDNRINALQRQNEMLNQQVSRLKHDLDQQMEENMRLLKHIEEQKYRNTSEINRLEEQKQQRITQLTQKLEKFEVNQSLLHQEINNLSEIIVEHERQNKKLEYEKNQLENEYNELSKRNEEWVKKNLESEISFNEQCADFQRSNDEINQLLRLNNLYLKEIQCCKSEIEKTKQENLLIKRQSEHYIAEQLSSLGQYYEEKYKRLQSECSKKAEQKQSNQNLVEVFKKKQSQRQNNKQKRNISTLSFREAINSLKADHESREFETQVMNSMASQKQNKNNMNVGGKKLTKHLSQQFKEPLPFQNHQNTMSTISSSDNIDWSEEVIFKANQHVKGKIKLSNLLNNNKESSITRHMQAFQTSSNQESIEGKKFKSHFSHFTKN